ncbi:MAG: MerR family transcriptional regulator [Clostridiales bacterium]|nr:MerR family transcriptional regulator [Clostridiales bacterium]
MQIKDVTEKTGLTKKAIRYYEECGFFTPPKKENGYKDYQESDIELLLQIKKLRLLDFTIQEIKDYVDGREEEVIKEKIAQNESLIQEMESHNQKLRDMLKKEFDLENVIRKKREAQLRIVWGNWIFGLFNVLLFLLILFLCIKNPEKIVRLNEEFLFGLCVVLSLGVQCLRGKKLKKKGNILYKKKILDYVVLLVLNAFSYLESYYMIQELWIHRGIVDCFHYGISIVMILAFILMIAALILLGFLDSRPKDVEFEK